MYFKSYIINLWCWYHVIKAGYDTPALDKISIIGVPTAPVRIQGTDFRSLVEELKCLRIPDNFTSNAKPAIPDLASVKAKIPLILRADHAQPWD